MNKKNSDKCYWWTQSLDYPVYNPGCQLKPEKQFFDFKTVEEIGYKYCPFCGGKIDLGIKMNLTIDR